MKLTVKSEYAFLALIDLAEHYSEGYIKIEHIAKRKGIPMKFLESILLSLKKAGFCDSRRGTCGGYMLGKSPGMISLAEIIRLMDGALAPVGSVSTFFYRYTPIEKNEKMKGILKDIRDYVAEKMENITLADLV
ncbi:MAG: Rrf2 family transcriptional regulator [Chrysiogenales bacterium]|nr:MAG: Rrf2 family transcriptional regulator [Chrysiogenales bacterium]